MSQDIIIEAMLQNEGTYQSIFKAKKRKMDRRDARVAEALKYGVVPLY